MKCLPRQEWRFLSKGVIFTTQTSKSTHISTDYDEPVDNTTALIVTL